MLPSETLEIISKVGPLDILIGTPTFNSEQTIGHVAKAIKLGLIKYFPTHRAGFVHMDAQSTDQTVSKLKQELKTANRGFNSMVIINEKHPTVRGTALPIEEISVSMPKTGKGNALRGFFEIAQVVDVKACAVFDSDLRSITPEWIAMMIGPVLLKRYDYVTPQYCRHKYDGTITNSIVYPLMTALYGQDIRQPMGGEFGFSPRLIDVFLDKEFKSAEVERFGIDVWMTTLALTHKMNVCQSFLGAKIHDHKDPSVSLAPMFKQVIGTIFELMRDHEDKWKKTKLISSVKTFGFGCTVIPEEVKINQAALAEKFQQGFEKHGCLWKEIMSEQNFKKVISLLEQEPDQLSFPRELWVKAIYDFASFYNRTKKKSVRNNTVLSLVPLYFAYTASFINKTRGDSFDQAEHQVESLVQEFLQSKPYLLSVWDNQKVSNKRAKQDMARLPIVPIG